MATAPTVVARLVSSSFTTTTTPKTAGTFTCSAGDVLVAKAVAENGSATFTGVPTGVSGAVFTLGPNIGTTNQTGRSTIWTCVVPSGQTVTVSLARTGTAAGFGLEVVQYSGSDGVGASWSAQNAASAAPSATASALGDNSAIEMAVTDFAAAATTGKTYRTTGLGTFTETAATQAGSQYTYYLGRYADAGAAGSKTVGMTAPNQVYTVAAIEIKGAAGVVAPKQLAALGVG